MFFDREQRHQIPCESQFKKMECITYELQALIPKTKEYPGMPNFGFSNYSSHSSKEK